jgi:nitrite reductase/ring-hydroxylating ferredoxin subunit
VGEIDDFHHQIPTLRIASVYSIISKHSAPDARRQRCRDVAAAGGSVPYFSAVTGSITPMPDVFVAKVSQFPDGERRIVSHGGREIGVFHWQGRFYAYENLCLHQGGPACEGIMMHKVEDVIGPDRTWHGQKFSDQEIHFVCPWHGYEYDLKTGECAADRKLRLKSFDVVRRGEDIYVVAG